MPEKFDSVSVSSPPTALKSGSPPELDPVENPESKLETTPHTFGFANYVWVSVFWLGITYLWGGFNGVILPELNRQLVPEGVKGTTLGIITACGMLVAILVQPTAGALSDISIHPWGKRRPFILLGGVLVVIGLFVTGLMALYFRHWWVLLVCYVFLQFSDNIAQGAYQGMMPDIVPQGSRGKASGAMGIAQVLGNVAGGGAATYFIDQNKPEVAIVLVMIIFTLSLYPTLFLVKEKRQLIPPLYKSRFSVIIGTVRELWQHKAFIRFIISRLFVLTSIAVITNFALYFLQDVIGAKEGKLTEAYTMLVLVVVVFSLLTVLPAAWLSDKVGRKNLVIASCVAGVIGTVLMSTARSLPEVVIYGAILGVTTGIFNSVDWALATDLIPREAAGRFMGISNLAGAGSQALAGFMGGILLDSFNAIGLQLLNVKNFGFTALFLAAGGSFMLGIFFLWKIQEPEV